VQLYNFFSVNVCIAAEWLSKLNILMQLHIYMKNKHLHGPSTDEKHETKIGLRKSRRAEQTQLNTYTVQPAYPYRSRIDMRTIQVDAKRLLKQLVLHERTNKP